MQKTALSLLFAAAALVFSLPAIAAEAPTVVTSIKPVHSLVASVMKGAGEPHLIVKAGGSPHSYSMKPSDAAALEKAKLVFWIGDELELFLEDSIEQLARNAEVVGLSEAPGVALLPFREGGPWAEHDDEHSEQGHERHEHEEHGHAEHADHGHEAEHDHAHGERDMHIWLDPENAKAMVAAVAEALIRSDPDNSGIYHANRMIMERRLDQLSAEIAAELAPVKDRPFVVFHDAFQYLERRFGLNTVGSITVSPDRQPGAARLSEMRGKIAELQARCVFAEPQFEPRLVGVVVEGTQARTGILDPLGAELEDGPDLYFELMRRNAAALRNCLSENS
ncbi:zinc ABC transporter substrate-binding protein ZnuA [Pelagibius litoralis]|uniref:High-affinity zinc uptake system protein ZnuA n=1 Tax=Pelagibius litoralis TaxID=374515 RepID=A0A967EYX8_9PROT|nr:zinc ABC transporter substrate-binding protein ZnuA [Pelagibius litoralis]NIA69997.1 zinc ABC transporter substrate-binding protein ZnuA [Pelagibius litoralis]